MDPLKANANSRRSTVAELEECLNNSFLSNTTKCFQNPQVKSAIGRVSFAVQFEKSGLASVEESEDAFSKAATAISDVLTLPEVQQNEESRYWLKLFELHVNKHLHEIVLLADSNKKKPPAHYDKLEDENEKLKEEIASLRQLVADLNAELEEYKGAMGGAVPLNSSVIRRSINIQDSSVINSPGINTSAWKDRSTDVSRTQLNSSTVEADTNDIDSQIFKKFDRAKLMIQDLKGYDISIRKQLELYGMHLKSSSDPVNTSLDSNTNTSFSVSPIPSSPFQSSKFILT